MNSYIILGFLAVALLAFLGGRWSEKPISLSTIVEEYKQEVSKPTPETPESGVEDEEMESLPPPVIASGSTVDLSGQGLSTASQDIFKKTETTVLDLSHNTLTGALPGEVRHLQNLRVLDLSHNNFTGVPAEIGQLRMLETLDLSFNPITGLPYELAHLKNLKTLDLRGTHYAPADLAIISAGLSASVDILVD